MKSMPVFAIALFAVSMGCAKSPESPEPSTASKGVRKHVEEKQGPICIRGSFQHLAFLPPNLHPLRIHFGF
jgi:hypothetical protein